MRVKRGYTSRRRHKKILKQAKGFRGRRKSCYKLAKDAVEKSLQYAYRDRRAKKRDFRRLWIIRIGAASREHGMSYSQFMHGLSLANCTIDRKQLASLAFAQPEVFASLVEQSRSALTAKAA